MSTGQIRTLKHDLRTPINHIMGYSELLVEEATDADDRVSTTHFSTLLKMGQGLLEALDQTLPASQEWGAQHFHDLRARAKPLAENIAALSSSGNCADSYLEILEKIHQAANHFMFRIEQLDSTQS